MTTKTIEGTVANAIDRDAIYSAIANMVNGWDLESLIGHANDSIGDYYLGNSVDQSEIDELLEDFGD